MPCAGALVAKQRVGDTPTWLARQRGGAHRLDAHDAGAERELSVSRAALQLMDEVALLPVCAQPLRDRKEQPHVVRAELDDVQLLRERRAADGGLYTVVLRSTVTCKS